MLVTVRLLTCAIGLLALMLPARAEGPRGIWLTKDADAHVRIADCGGALCGTIVWLKDPIDDATGRPMLDKHNPDPVKRNRPILGISVMYGMRPSGPGKWSGHFYNSDDGKTYVGNLLVLDRSTVKVEGCLIICMGETWHRVDTTAKPARPVGRPRNKT
jgi:uncharacterized protein (DUF2147 family)